MCAAWPDSGPNVSGHCSSESGQCAEIRMKGVTSILALGAIKGDGGRPFERLSTVRTCCPCVCFVWEPFNSLVLARVRINCEWVILVRLHWETASSGTGCSSCKPVVLVTLWGCHLLDGLVAWSPSKHARKLVQCSREDCEGCCARTAGAAKSNSSRARREGRPVVQLDQVLELVVSTPRGRVWLAGHH
jgi:hypothetical protein